MARKSTVNIPRGQPNFHIIFQIQSLVNQRDLEVRSQLSRVYFILSPIRVCTVQNFYFYFSLNYSSKSQYSFPTDNRIFSCLPRKLEEILYTLIQ